MGSSTLIATTYFAYDANGNTLSDSQGRSFTWDFENRLTQAVVPGANGGTTTFKYDPFQHNLPLLFLGFSGLSAFLTFSPPGGGPKPN